MYSSSQAKTLEVNHPSLHVIEIFETEGGAVYKSVKQQDGVAAKKLQCPAARRRLHLYFSWSLSRNWSINCDRGELNSLHKGEIEDELSVRVAFYGPSC
jgi:hypothetical protein